MASAAENVQGSFGQKLPFSLTERKRLFHLVRMGGSVFPTHPILRAALSTRRLPERKNPGTVDETEPGQDAATRDDLRTLGPAKGQGKQAVAEIGTTKVLNPTFIE
jgi:hypothetical protein